MTPNFSESPPDAAEVTAYDRTHLKLYLRLLDADEAGADWREVTPVLFGIDASDDPDRAERIHAAHLARARWMTTHGAAELSR